MGGYILSIIAYPPVLNTPWKLSNSSLICRYLQNRRASSQESRNCMVGSSCQIYPLAAKRQRHSFKTVLFEYYAETIVVCSST